MKEISLTYVQIIAFKNKCKTQLFYEEVYDNEILSKYILTFKYDNLLLHSLVTKDTSDFVDFETNYKHISNIPALPISYIRVDETSLVDDTIANTIIRGYNLNVVQNESISELNLVWDNNIDILLAKTYLTHVQEGDYIDLFIVPLNDGLIGAITSISSVNQAIVTVSDTVVKIVLSYWR